MWVAAKSWTQIAASDATRRVVHVSLSCEEVEAGESYTGVVFGSTRGAPSSLAAACLPEPATPQSTTFIKFDLP
jgi:hypothetical protein